MAARDIEYVEIYTADGESTVDYFVTAMGFAAVAESATDGMRSALLRQNEVQIVVSTGPDTEEFLDRHGTGITDIALTCDDVATTRDAAVAAGARSLGESESGPIVSGFGDVRHTLLPAATPGARLPGGRAWVPSPPRGGPVGRIRLLDHVAVCLEAGALAEVADFYTRALGLSRFSSEYVAFGDQAMDSIVVRSASEGVTFTLIEPDREKHAGQIDAFLDRNNGPGVQHLAFLVDEIAATVHEFRARGVKFLPTPGAYYEMLAERFPDIRKEITDLRAAHVLVDRDEWGYLLQLFTRSPHERNTLFYELVQRRGSRGFGSSNIRALYEAVERDRLTAR